MSHYVSNEEFLAALVAHKKACLKAKKAKKDPPPLPEYIGEVFLLMATRISRKPNFNGYCVDDQTEALTKRGWLRHDQLTCDDTILSLDIFDHQLKWSPVIDIYRDKHYDGNMFHLTNQGLDALVTPGHKFVVGMDLRPIEHLRKKDSITIMGDALQQNGRVYNDDFVELMGWYVTEGSRISYMKVDGPESSYITITQNEGLKAEKIRRCITHYGHERLTPPEVKQKEFYVRVSAANELHQLAPNKVMTFEFINALTTSQRDLLIRTMVAGDGWTLKNKSGTMRYCQKDTDHVNRFVYLCALAGYSTRSIQRSWDTQFGPCTMWVISLYPKRTVYCEKTDFHGAGRSQVQSLGFHASRQPTIPYRGIVWCPTTEYGTWVCRRNGIVYVTGNSYREDMVMDAVENCIRYCNNFDPKKSHNPFAYFTRIILFALTRRIGREKRQVYIRYKVAERASIDQTLAAYSTEDHQHLPDPALLDYANVREFIEDYESKLKGKPSKKKPKSVVPARVDTDDDEEWIDITDEIDALDPTLVADASGFLVDDEGEDILT